MSININSINLPIRRKKKNNQAKTKFIHSISQCVRTKQHITRNRKLILFKDKFDFVRLTENGKRWVPDRNLSKSAAEDIFFFLSSRSPRSRKIVNKGKKTEEEKEDDEKIEKKICISIF